MRGRRSLRTAAAILVAVTAAALAGPAATHRYTYSIASRGDVEADLEWFRHIARTALSNERGWTLGGHNRFVEVPSGGDFRLILASPAEVNAASPVCDRPWSCRVGDDVLINDYRWRHGTEAWTLGYNAYRRYVVNHEVGHWLGLGHVSYCGKGNRAAVMQQQSKSLEGCEANVWPLYSEWLRLGRSAYWPTPIPAWFWPWLGWYVGHADYTTPRSVATYPDAAPSPVPAWTWEFLRWYLHHGEYAEDDFRDPATYPDEAPSPVPRWTWQFYKWWFGHEEYTAFRSPVTRPDAAPRRLPDWAWARLSVHLAATRLGL